VHISVAEPAGAIVTCSPLCECACVCVRTCARSCAALLRSLPMPAPHTPCGSRSSPRHRVLKWPCPTGSMQRARRLRQRGASAQLCELNPVLDSSGGSPGRFQAKRLFLLDPVSLSDLCSHASAARTEKEARQATLVVGTRTQQHARGAAQPCACQLPYTVEDDVQRMPAARDTPRAPAACKMRTS
jgi:hypothetical protein